MEKVKPNTCYVAAKSILFKVVFESNLFEASEILIWHLPIHRVLQQHESPCEKVVIPPRSPALLFSAYSHRENNYCCETSVCHVVYTGCHKNTGLGL